jgi:hypothetical protein
MAYLAECVYGLAYRFAEEHVIQNTRITSLMDNLYEQLHEFTYIHVQCHIMHLGSILENQGKLENQGINQ